MSSPSVSNHEPSRAPSATALPITHNLKLVYASSLLIALLMTIASLAGLLYGETLYGTEEMILLKQPTDLFSLIVALPLMLASLWLAKRGRLLGLLCWPGTLLYVLYISLAYAIGVALNILLPLYITISSLSAYTLIGLVSSIDIEAIQQKLVGTVPARAAGAILFGLAVLFGLMNMVQIFAALTDPTHGYQLSPPVWISDFVVLAPTWLIGGFLLWQRQALGYASGTGLLLLGSMMFIGPIFSLLFPTLINDAPFPLLDIALMLIAGLICFIPLTLFVRGILKADHES